MHQSYRVWRQSVLFVTAFIFIGVSISAQRQDATSRRGVPGLPPPDGPVVLYTAEQPRIRVVSVAD